MLIKQILFIALGVYINSTVFCQTGLEILVEKIQELNLRQIIIFTKSPKNVQMTELVNTCHNKINQIIPSTMIFPSAHYESSFSPIQEIYNKETVYIVYCRFLQSADFYNEMVKTFEFITNLAPTSARSYWLIIISNEIKLSDDQFKMVFHYGWLNKCLDLTIVCIAKLKEIEIRHYNPYSRIYTTTLLTEQTILFPNKLQNMQGHPIKLYLVDFKPYLYVLRDTNNSISTIYGTCYPITEILSTYFNFTIKFVTNVSEDYIVVFNEISIALQNERIDMSTLPLPLGHVKNYQKLDIGIVFDAEDIVALVPKLPFVSISWSSSIMHNLFIVIIILIIINYFTRLSKFDNTYWQCMNTIQILFTAMSNKIPITLCERVFFLMIILVSAQYFNSIFVNVFTVNLNNKEMPFNTLDDFKKANLTIYAREAHFHSIYQFLENELNIHTWYGPACYESAIENRSFICLSAKTFVAKTLQQTNISSNWKTSKYVFGSVYRGYYYPKASLYARKFDKVIRRIVESGIRQLWREYKQNVTESTHHLTNDRKSVSAIRLFYFVACGHFLSIIIFCIEYSSKYF